MSLAEYRALLRVVPDVPELLSDGRSRHGKS
jgi:hypothetical protein